MLTDDEVQRLLSLPKVLVAVERDRLLGPGERKRGQPFRETRAALRVDTPGSFELIVLRHVEDRQRFSFQLLYTTPAGVPYRLLRLAGRPRPHTNRMERETVTARFRFNRLTERYQRSRREGDHFAYAAPPGVTDFTSAWAQMVHATNIRVEGDREDTAGG